MLANFLNKSKPINFIGLLIFFFVSFLFNIFNEGFTVDKLLKNGIILVLFIIIFFIYNFIVSKNKLTHDNSFAYFLFIIFNVSILSEIEDYKILILAIIHLLFLRKIYSLRSSKNVFEKVFDSGFWLGIFFIFEPLSIFLFLLIYIASYLHSKITIHTLLIPILGFATPLIAFFTYNYWFDKTGEFTKLFYFENFFDIVLYSKTKYIGSISCVLLITICAIFIKSIKALSVNNTFKKSWILLIYNFVVLIIFILFHKDKNGSELVFILFPTSIILANGIELFQKKILKNFVLYLFLTLSIIMHYLL